MDKLKITEDFNQSYNELKSGIKEKYLNMLYGYVDEARERAMEVTSKHVGDDILKLTEEIEDLRKLVQSETKKFYKSEEYVSVQERLVALKERLAEASEEEKEDLQKQISKAMAEVVTKNITIKNRLKPHTDKIKYNEDLVNSTLQELNFDVKRIEDEILGFLREKIEICVKAYNDELHELNASFNMPISDKTEIPFDGKGLRLEFPILEFRKKKTVMTSDIKEEERTIIASENVDLIKN